MFLSVVIPVRNEERCIQLALTRLIEQDYPVSNYELIVVDGESTDRTVSIVEAFMHDHPEVQISCVTNPGRLSSCGRNIGIRKSRGQMIAVIDGHVHVPNNQLFQHMERLTVENSARCLARPAPLRMPELQRGMAHWIALARKSWLGHSRSSYIYSDYEGFVDPVSSGFAYAREVFDDVGYFDENFDAAEDVEFHHRLKRKGIMAYTSPHLTIYSYPRESLRALFRQMTRYGIGRARLIRKHPDAFSWETLVPFVVFCTFAATPLVIGLGVIAPWLLFIQLSGLTVYLASVLLASILGPPYGKTWIDSIMISLAICVTHVGLGWGLLKGTIQVFWTSKRGAAAQRAL